MYSWCHPVPLGIAIGTPVLSDISSSCLLFLLPSTHPCYTKKVKFRTFLTSENRAVRCRSASRLSFDRVCRFCATLKGFTGGVLSPQISAFERWPAVWSVMDSALYGLEKPAPSISVLSPLNFPFSSPVFSLSFLLDVYFKVRHRSACLFPAFLQASLLLSITFICHSGSDGLSALPHVSRSVLYVHNDAHAKIPEEDACAGISAHVLTFFLFIFLN